MLRSAIDGPAVGKNLLLHPVLITWGIFEDEVRPWEGMLGATFSDESGSTWGRATAWKYEQAATPPSILCHLRPLARLAREVPS